MARTLSHPGKILNDELEEIGLTAKKLADVIEVPAQPSLSAFGGKAERHCGHRLASQPVFRDVRGYELDLARQQTGKAIQKIPRRNETAEPWVPAA
jgi:antitoxin HigA-1